MPLNRKQKAFIDEYFLCNMNGTEAYMRVFGPKNRNVARANAAKLLATSNVKEEVGRRLDEHTMQANEVLARWGDISRGDMGDFMQIEGVASYLDLEKAKELGLLHLIKKVKDRVVMTSDKDGNETETHHMEIELYDALAAQTLIGKYHGLLVDRADITTKGESINLPDERTDRAILTLADALRESLSGAGSKSEGDMAAPEQAPVVSVPE